MGASERRLKKQLAALEEKGKRLARRKARLEADREDLELEILNHVTRHAVPAWHIIAEWTNEIDFLDNELKRLRTEWLKLKHMMK